MINSAARVVAFFLAVFIVTVSAVYPQAETDSVKFQKFCRHSEIPFRLRYLGTPQPHLQLPKNNVPQQGFNPKTNFTRRTSNHSPDVHISTTGDSVGVGWVRHFSSDLVPSSDYPNAMAADSSGNIYITGVSERTYSDGDFVTLKYNHRGILQWEARYTNPNHGYSQSYSIAVDSLENVYVTGYTTNPISGIDMLTIEYDSLGNQQWSQIFEGAGDSTDVATSIGVDNTGNCYVLGYSYNPATNYDIVLLSYSSTGVERWVTYFDGPAHGADYPTGLSIGTNGTVCITGSTNGGATGSDIITIQYDQQGTLQWKALYATAGIDYSTGVVTDDSGYVTVAGYSGLTDQGTSYLLLQYTSAGATRWVAPYNGINSGGKKPTDIALDNSGNIYVTGVVQSNGSENYLTVKYDHTSGGIIWEALYDNSYHGDDFAIGIAISTEGHIYVTGYSQFSTSTSFAFLTLGYDSSGKQFMSDRFVPNGSDAIPTAIVHDNNSNVFVGGPIIANSFDMQILKYSYFLQGQIIQTVDEGSTNDDLGAMVLDRFGNVYACGSNGESIIIQKYSNNLNLLWKVVIPDLSDASVVTGKLEKNERIALTGYTRNSHGDLDIITAEVTTDGTLSWFRTYNGPDSSDDVAVALTVDNSGNVIVTGSSYSPNTFNDIVTLKYSPDGVMRWVTRYNNFYNHDDLPASVALDKEQNIYLTGYTVRLNSSYDILTLKYDTNGVQQWIKYYNGPASGADFGRAIAIDTNDAIYVTGKSFGGQTSSSVVLLKYTTTGQLGWTSIYSGNETADNEPTAMALDPTGSPVVAGMAYHSVSSFDFLTLKFDTSGALIWKGEYDDFFHGIDHAIALTTDEAGYVYVTGNSLGSGSGDDITTVKYDKYGALQWIQRYNGNSSLDNEAVAVAADSNGNVFVGGISYNEITGYDWALIRYSFPPVESWPVRYDGPGTSGDMASAIATGPNGDIYLTGESENANLSILCTTLKYDQKGNQQWVRYYSGSQNSLNIGRDISTKRDGSPVVTGYDQEIGAPSFNYLTIQYSSTGDIEWVKTYAANGSNYNFATHVEVSRLQSVYVSGYTYTPATSYDYTPVKYSSDGVQQWAVQYNDSLNDNDLITAMVVDRSENLFVTGVSGNGLRSTNYATVKFDANGLRRWVAIYDGPAHLDDRAIAIATDSTGNVYVTGWSMGVASDHDITTIKYDSAGVQQWVVTYDGPASNRDDPAGIGVDNNGNIYVGGTSYDAGFINPDFVLLKYNPAGGVEWIRRFDGLSSSDDILRKIVLDPAGNIYMTGSSTGSNGVSDIMTLKYDPQGTIRWTARLHEQDNSKSVPADIVLDKDTNVIVTGTTSGSTWSVITTIQYRQPKADAVSEQASIPVHYALNQNYPNPFNSSTLFTYSLAQRSYVRLDIYNILGQWITSLVNANQAPGNYRFSYDADRLTSGTYLYRLEAVPTSSRPGARKAFTGFKKMIYLK